MRRNFSKIKFTFWSGSTGRQIRSLGSDAITVSFYLMTAPTSNSIGLYYLPLPTLCHETGLALEVVESALQHLDKLGFAHYDHDAEMVWVVEMARHQLGDSIHPKDNIRKHAASELDVYGNHEFARQFREKYGEAFCLSEEGASKGL